MHCIFTMIYFHLVSRSAAGQKPIAEEGVVTWAMLFKISINIQQPPTIRDKMVEKMTEIWTTKRLGNVRK